jgi:hypothetical protein
VNQGTNSRDPAAKEMMVQAQRTELGMKNEIFDVFTILWTVQALLIDRLISFRLPHSLINHETFRRESIIGSIFSESHVNVCFH